MLSRQAAPIADHCYPVLITLLLPAALPLSASRHVPQARLQAADPHPAPPVCHRAGEWLGRVWGGAAQGVAARLHRSGALVGHSTGQVSCL